MYRNNSSKELGNVNEELVLVKKKETISRKYCVSSMKNKAKGNEKKKCTPTTFIKSIVGNEKTKLDISYY